MACGVLVPQPGTEPIPHALDSGSLNHWTVSPSIDILNSCAQFLQCQFLLLLPIKVVQSTSNGYLKQKVLDAKLRSQSKMQSVKIFPQSKTKQKHDLDGIILEERGLQNTVQGLSWWLSGKESAYQCRRHGFNPWSGRIPTHCRALGPRHHNYWACALEPGSRSCWVRVPQLLKTKPFEAVLGNKRSHHSEKRMHCCWRGAPAFCNWRKAHTAMKTQHKINVIKNKNKVQESKLI